MTSRKKVLIIGPAHGYREMFIRHGWGLGKTMEESDLVQFTGGHDVTPELYGEPRHPQTDCNPLRDQAEQQIYLLAKDIGMPIAGICRGGQFLNVMNGGSMYQHCNKHAISGVHDAVDDISGEVFKVTSTHHQMIRPTQDATVVVTAQECTQRERMSLNQKDPLITYGPLPDFEAVYYEETNTFCFQPHPEFTGHEELANRYFGYLAQYCGV